MLNNIGLPGLLLIGVVVLVLFGRGKISSMMGEVGKGITAFKRGMDDGRKEIEDASLAARDVVPPAGAHTTTTTSADGTVTTITPDRDRV
jgi:sec-independent protein translocase protein TatA